MQFRKYRFSTWHLWLLITLSAFIFALPNDVIQFVFVISLMIVVAMGELSLYVWLPRQKPRIRLTTIFGRFFSVAIYLSILTAIALACSQR